MEQQSPSKARARQRRTFEYLLTKPTSFAANCSFFSLDGIVKLHTPSAPISATGPANWQVRGGPCGGEESTRGKTQNCATAAEK